MAPASRPGTTISWLLGFLFLGIGLINCFWGNDPGYGLFVLLLSLPFFTPVSRRLPDRFRLSPPTLLKVVIALFILWSAMGVGELPDKMDMMLAAFSR